VFLSLAGNQVTMRTEKETHMKDKKNNTDKADKKSMKALKKGLNTPAVPVPPAATELSEEDLKKVTGGGASEQKKWLPSN
jgi:bacteriocin-like protein